MSRPRILHVVQSFASGVATAIAQYVHATPEHEHHLIFARTRAEYVPDGELDLFASHRSMPPALLPAIREVRRACAELSPAVLHAHSSFGGAYARLAKRSGTGMRIVYTPHCYGFERRDQPAFVLGGYRLAERLLSYNTHTIAACSLREARLALALNARLRAVFVPNVPLPVPGFEDHDDGERRGIVAGGRLSPQKDPRFFRDIVLELRRSVLGLQAMWVGDGDAGMRAALEDAGVVVTGWVPRSTALRHVRQAAVYVHTAVWEGFPIAVLEATMLGVPIVARSIPAFDGIGAAGLVTGPMDAAETLLGLLASADARRANHAEWERVLAGNNQAAQSAALLEVYRLESDLASTAHNQ